jgi:hypothetical protein
MAVATQHPERQTLVVTVAM